MPEQYMAPQLLAQQITYNAIATDTNIMKNTEYIIFSSVNHDYDS